MQGTLDSLIYHSSTHQNRKYHSTCLPMGRSRNALMYYFKLLHLLVMLHLQSVNNPNYDPTLPPAAANQTDTKSNPTATTAITRPIRSASSA